MQLQPPQPPQPPHDSWWVKEMVDQSDYIGQYTENNFETFFYGNTDIYHTPNVAGLLRGQIGARPICGSGLGCDRQRCASVHHGKNSEIKYLQTIVFCVNGPMISTHELVPECTKIHCPYNHHRFWYDFVVWRAGRTDQYQDILQSAIQQKNISLRRL